MKAPRFELLDFQVKAIKHVYDSYINYYPFHNLYTSNVDDIKRGEQKPYLHRIKAVTGAGKTPILAKLSGYLGDCIILWTTPKTAVISQTKSNLEGKYRHLLSPETEIFDLSDISPTEWESVRDRTSGLTILVSTVASFNQKGDRLKLHQTDSTGFTRWGQLKTIDSGGMRERPLYIFYDEGHNVTTNQFKRLLELRPAALFLASASNPSKDLEILLPGETSKDKERIFNEERTTVVKTKDVVDANLLKQGIEIHDSDVDWREIVRFSNDKLNYLQGIAEEELPIACFIVDRTDKGIDVWNELINQGVPGEKIAVHLNKASEAARKKFGGELPIGFKDTYTDKLTPEDLREQQYTHLIWNLSLKEGWDEPWAYVAYIHDKQSSVQDIEQKIGRFIRNPHRDKNGSPLQFQNPDLNKSYFYFNCTNKIFSKVLEELKAHLKTEGFDTLKVREEKESHPAEEVVPSTTTELPLLAIYPDTDAISSTLLDEIIIYDRRECLAPGLLKKEELKIGTLEVTSSEEALEKSLQVPSGQMIQFFLESRDSRIVKSSGSTGGWLPPEIWENQKMNFDVCYGSPAHKKLQEACDKFCDEIDRFLKLDADETESYIVKSFKMNNPNGGDSAYSKKLHKVYHFKNGIHQKYNGFNDFELDLAYELDKHGTAWARNPSRTGYSIPLTKPTANSKSFFPDFIVIDDERILFLETKGGHLLTDAVQEKLISLTGIRKVPQKYKIFFITDTGVEIIDSVSGKTKRNSSKYSLLYRDSQANFRHKNFMKLQELVGDITESCV